MHVLQEYELVLSTGSSFRRQCLLCQQGWLGPEKKRARERWLVRELLFHEQLALEQTTHLGFRNEHYFSPRDGLTFWKGWLILTCLVGRMALSCDFLWVIVGTS